MHEINVYKGLILYRAEFPEFDGGLECIYGFSKRSVVRRAKEYLDRIHGSDKRGYVETIWYDPQEDNNDLVRNTIRKGAK